jgi:hypothetical protein
MIVWLASYPRSGNTLLRLILKEAFNINTFSLYNDKWDIGGDASLANFVGHRDIGNDLQEFLTIADALSELIFVKTHELPSDNRKTIYVVRNGFSSVSSYYNYYRNILKNNSITLADLILGNCNYGDWSSHINAWSQINKNVLFIRYERLCADYYEEVQRLAEFLGLECRQFNLPRFEEFRNINSKFFNVGEDSAHLNNFGPFELQLFKALHGKTMCELGYLDSQEGYLESSLLITESIRKLVEDRDHYMGLFKYHSTRKQALMYNLWCLILKRFR